MTLTTSTDAPETDVENLRIEVDRLDAQILEAVRRRTELVRRIGKITVSVGGPRSAHIREMHVVERYGVLGRDGYALALLLLRLGRGRAGSAAQRT